MEASSFRLSLCWSVTFGLKSSYDAADAWANAA